MGPLNKFTKWTAFAVAICAITIFFYVRHRSGSGSIDPQKVVVEPEKTKRAKIWREVLAPKIEQKTPSPASSQVTLESLAENIDQNSNPEQPEATEGDPKAETEDLSQVDTATLCLSDWNMAAGMELSQFEHVIRHGQYSLSATCKEAMLRDQEFYPIKWFLEKCSQSSDVVPENTERCVAQSFEYRSIAIAKVYLKADPSTFAYGDLETSVLANILTRNTLDISKSSNEQLEQSIKIADEMIQREPDLYGAYKIKLVSLLMKEAKYQDPLDDEEFDQIISQMSEFEEPDPTVQLREESVDLELNEKINQLRPRQEEIASEVDSIMQELLSLQEQAKDDPKAQQLLDSNEQYQSLNSQLERLTAEGEELAGVIVETQDRLDSGSMNAMEVQDPDLIMLPFIRIMVKKDYDNLAEEAQNYIDEYPDSPYGHYFLAKALWQTGQQSEALVALKSAYVNDSTYDILLRNFQRPENNDPVAYLSNMRLMLGVQ